MAQDPFDTLRSKLRERNARQAEEGAGQPSTDGDARPQAALSEGEVRFFVDALQGQPLPKGVTLEEFVRSYSPHALRHARCGWDSSCDARATLSAEVASPEPEPTPGPRASTLALEGFDGDRAEFTCEGPAGTGRELEIPGEPAEPSPYRELVESSEFEEHTQRELWIQNQQLWSSEARRRSNLDKGPKSRAKKVRERLSPRDAWYRNQARDIWSANAGLSLERVAARVERRVGSRGWKATWRTVKPDTISRKIASERPE